MSKYLEALNFFKRVAHHVPLKSATDEFCEEYDGNLIVLKELVEKATPKKPVKAEPTLARKATRNYCSCCGLRLKKTWRVCPRCETRIDWSEDESNCSAK